MVSRVTVGGTAYPYAGPRGCGASTCFTRKAPSPPPPSPSPGRAAVAPRILSVGDHGRAERIASLFDAGTHRVVTSTRSFVTHTGLYKGVAGEGRGGAEMV
jgi:hypothetical protein